MWTTAPWLAARLVNPEDGKHYTVGSNVVLEWQCPDHPEHTWRRSPLVESRNKITVCPICHPAHASAAELKLGEVVKTLVGDDTKVKFRIRSVLPSGKELDIYVPSKKVAIEYNGVFYHSEGAGKEKSAQADKWRECKDLGIQLIQIWEDDWNERKSICIRMIAAKLGATSALSKFSEFSGTLVNTHVGARSCKLVLVGAQEAKTFLNENHIQGATTASCHFGLRDKTGVLRALLSVRSPRGSARQHRGEGVWDIVRYATLGGVPGGFTRLMTYAEKTLKEKGEIITSWVSFSANDVSDGSLYRKSGFIKDKELAADYMYVGNFVKWKRTNKENFQKKRFRETPELEWDESWTEHDAALANNLYRAYDSGKIRWVKPVL